MPCNCPPHAISQMLKVASGPADAERFESIVSSVVVCVGVFAVIGAHEAQTVWTTVVALHLVLVTGHDDARISLAHRSLVCDGRSTFTAPGARAICSNACRIVTTESPAFRTSHFSLTINRSLVDPTLIAWDHIRLMRNHLILQPDILTSENAMNIGFRTGGAGQIRHLAPTRIGQDAGRDSCNQLLLRTPPVVWKPHHVVIPEAVDPPAPWPNVHRFACSADCRPFRCALILRGNGARCSMREYKRNQCHQGR